MVTAERPGDIGQKRTVGRQSFGLSVPPLSSHQQIVGLPAPKNSMLQGYMAYLRHSLTQTKLFLTSIAAKALEEEHTAQQMVLLGRQTCE